MRIIGAVNIHGKDLRNSDHKRAAALILACKRLSTMCGAVTPVSVPPEWPYAGQWRALAAEATGEPLPLGVLAEW